MFKKKVETEKNGKNPIGKFKKLSKVLIFLSIVILLWVIIVAAGIVINNMENDWAYLSLDNWVIFSIIVIADILFLVGKKITITAIFRRWYTSYPLVPYMV